MTAQAIRFDLRGKSLFWSSWLYHRRHSNSEQILFSRSSNKSLIQQMLRIRTRSCHRAKWTNRKIVIKLNERSWWMNWWSDRFQCQLSYDIILGSVNLIASMWGDVRSSRINKIINCQLGHEHHRGAMYSIIHGMWLFQMHQRQRRRKSLAG